MHEIANNVVCATSNASDQPAHTRSLIRAFASRLGIYHLEFQSLRGGCTGLSEYTLVKMLEISCTGSIISFRSCNKTPPGTCKRRLNSIDFTIIHSQFYTPLLSYSRNTFLTCRPVIIAFGVPLIATETFLCLSESFLCHLQHTKSPHKISQRKRYYNTLIYSSYNTFCGGPVSPP